MLKEIFSPAVCAECKLCCNFHRESAWESPFLPEELAHRMKEQGIEVQKREQGGWSFVYHFSGSEARNCPKLNVLSGCQLSENDKPFECKIWPLRIMKKENRLTIGKYRNCPGIQGEAGRKLDQFVKEKLLNTLLDFIKKNPDAIRPFSPEYIILWQEEK